MHFISLVILSAAIPAVLATPVPLEENLNARNIVASANNIAEVHSADVSNIPKERDYDAM
jgi:hypothetical protein